ncbi:hypothetical protein MPH_00822 [Macrophomina phaseolina MS6]|uniref:Target of rapamycin complex subunit LST8 n=5 Tax=Botryosphaeriaceae TaxID=45131 RepID=K2SAI5_MACPH|nr:hypothetical protein MPH_00822 [Macrophomina phaseolina MS6]
MNLPRRNGTEMAQAARNDGWSWQMHSQAATSAPSCWFFFFFFVCACHRHCTAKPGCAHDRCESLFADNTLWSEVRDAKCCSDEVLGHRQGDRRGQPGSENDATQHDRPLQPSTSPPHQHPSKLPHPTTANPGLPARHQPCHQNPPNILTPRACVVCPRRCYRCRCPSASGYCAHAMSVILCTAGYDHTIRFWEALSGICSRTIPHPDSQVNRLCISPDKRFLAAAGHHTVKLYDIKSSNPNAVLTFEGHTANITGVAFHCEGKWMVTSSEDGTVKIWDTRSGNVQRNYSHGGIAVNDVVIHPNQGELISCDRGGNVRIWDLGENKCSHQLIPEDDVAVASVTVASDGSMLCAGNNSGNVYVWRMIQDRDITSLVPVCRFVAHNTYITRVLLSPDVRHLATCSADHTARIWSVDTSQPHNVTGAEQLPVEREPGAFPLETTLHGHQRWVWDCAFSADSAYLVTACSDHYARLWELSSQSIIRQYNGHHRGAVCVALNDTAIN